MTSDDIAILEDYYAKNAPEVLEPEGGGSFSRIGKQLGNFPSYVAQSFARTAQGVGNLGLAPEDQIAPVDVPKPFDIPEPQGLSQSAIDLLLEHLGPELVSALVPYAGVSKLGGASAFASKSLGLEMGAQAAAGAFTGIKYGPEGALKQAAVGGGLGGIAMLPHAQRLLPLAGLTAADTAATYYQTGSGEAAATQAGLDIAFGLLPGSLKALRGKKPPTVDSGAAIVGPKPSNLIPFKPDDSALQTSAQGTYGQDLLGPDVFAERTRPYQVSASPERLQADYSGILDDLSNRELGTSAEQTYGSQLDINSIPGIADVTKVPAPINRFREASQVVSPRLLVPSNPATPLSLSDIFTGPKPPRPSETFGRDLIIRPNEPAPLADVPPLVTEQERNVRDIIARNFNRDALGQAPENYIELKGAQIIQDPAKGKIPVLPEYRRTEGGNVADQYVLNRLGLASGRGVLGYTAGSYLEDDPEKKGYAGLAAGALAIGAPYLPNIARRIGVRNELGAINLGQPFRTSFEREAVEDASGRIIKIGNRDIGKSGLIDIKSFKKAANISDDEIESYRLKFPEAFTGQALDVQKLKAGLKESPLLEVVDLPHDEGLASEIDKAQAELQHILDTKAPGRYHLVDGRIEHARSTESIYGVNIDALDPEITTAFNRWQELYEGASSSDVVNRSASARYEYEQREVNPRPLAEMQKKGGFDQLVKIPVDQKLRDNIDDLPRSSFDKKGVLNEVYHSEGHWLRNTEGDDINVIAHTRNYIDEIPGKGRSIIMFENQSQWSQELRDYYEKNPLIIDPNKLPEGFTIKPTPTGFVLKGTENYHYTAYGRTPEETIVNWNKEARGQAPGREHPILNDYKRVSMKALVDKALKDPEVKGVLITDADTVTMTERHDQSATLVRRVDKEVLLRKDPDSISDRYTDSDMAVGKIQKGIFAKIKRPSGNDYIIRIDDPEANTKGQQVELAKEIHKLYDGGKTLPKEGEYYIPQHKGMVQHYDKDLPNIMEELTGTQGQKVSLGEGSHRAYESYGNNKLAWRADHPYKEGEYLYYSSEEEAITNVKFIKQEYPDYNGKVSRYGSKALNNKSDISGRWFSLDKLRRLKKDRPELSGAEKFPDPLGESVRGDVSKTLQDVKRGVVPEGEGDILNQFKKPTGKGMKRGKGVRQGKGGFLSTHATVSLAGASIVGSEEYVRSGGDPSAALAGAIIGGAGGFMGYKAIEMIARPNPRLTSPKAIKTEVKAGVKKLFTENWKDIAGEDVRGRGGVMSKFIRELEHWGRLHLPEDIKTAWTQARGTGVLAVQAVKDSFEALKDYKPPIAIQEAAAKFIEGKLLEPTETIRLIRSEGGIAPDAWEAIAAASRPKGWGIWKVETGPDTVSNFRVSPETRAKLMAAEEAKLRSTLGKDHEMYFKFINTARKAVDNLQYLMAEGMPDGHLKRTIQGSYGQYVTRTYRIFTDPNYRPTDAQIDKSMVELGEFLDLKGIDHTREYLRTEIEQYLNDIKISKEIYGMPGGRKLDTTLLKEREELTPTFRELLGEYTDPQEKLLQAISRLYPTAQASRFVSLTKDMVIDGMPASMSAEEWVINSKKINELLAEAQKTGVGLNEIKAHYNRLNEYVELPKNLKYGALKGLRVNRFIADQLLDYEGPLGMAAHPIMRGINNWTKIIHTAYDPIRHVRNIVTTPILLWIGRASSESTQQAWDVLRKKKGIVWEEMVSNGILTADQVASEFRGTMDNVFNGHYDSSLTKKIKAFHNKTLEVYRHPDLVVRAATYLEAKARISAKEGLAIDHPDVIRKAVQWTDERTMNYDNIAPAVRLARQLPFFNLYISYTAEITRIMTNVGKDALKGDIHSLAQLGTLAGAFEAIQATSEAMLSDKDRKDWKRANAQSPAYSRSRYKVVTGKDAKGNFKYLDITPWIPTDNINQMFRSIAKGDTEGLIAVNPIVGLQNTPVFKLIAESVAGKDMQSHREFRDATDHVMNIVEELSPTLTPGIGYEWKKISSIGQTNLKTGRTETFGGTISRYVLGANYTSVNPTITQRNAVAEAKRHIANERAYLNDVLKIKGVSPAKKERAVKKYKEAVASALETFRNKSNQ